MDLDAEGLRELIAGGEGPRLEFKRGLPRPERIARTLCAFANTKGGLLVVGVEDDGAPYGVPRPGEVVRQLREVGREVLEPPVGLQASTLKLADKAVVVCAIVASRKRPHAVRRAGREPEIVVRVGASNRVARGATLAALQRPPATRGSLAALEQSVLAWVAERTATERRGPATVKGFCSAHNIGVQRARRAFVRLEREGFLVGYGGRARRVYAVP